MNCIRNLKVASFLLFVILPIFNYAQTKQKFSFKIPQEKINALFSAPPVEENFNIFLGIPLTLYTPEGKPISLYFFENKSMSNEMKTILPQVKTLSGYSTDNTQYLLNIILDGTSISGFTILENGLPIQIKKELDQYVSYYVEAKPFQCEVTDSGLRNLQSGNRTASNGSSLRTYDFAVVITDEFEAQFGGAAAAIGVVNEMNVIYNRELAVNLTVTVRPEDNTFNVIPPGGSSANYGGTVVSAYFTSSEYDLGHVFHYSTPFWSGQGRFRRSL
ncbi:MAG: hypothetical protein R2774_14230 [Saprospiraceae bacterium]